MSPRQPKDQSGLNLKAISATTPSRSKEGLSKAKKEEYLYLDKREQEHWREQNAKSVLHWTLQAIIVIAGIVVMICIVIRGLHLILPKDRMWLANDQIEALDDLVKYVASGTLGGLLTKYITKNMDGNPDE